LPIWPDEAALEPEELELVGDDADDDLVPLIST